jgi:predicted N-formylglutamate amidohydrolase
MGVSVDEASEIVSMGADARAIFTCEHASERLPDGWTWPDADRWLVGTHWAFDLGAADLARELAISLGAVAVLSRFSRLLVDPNRSKEAPDLFRATAEGRTVELNRDVRHGDRSRRLALFDGYHDAVDREVARPTSPVVLSVHSFTPVYEGVPRAVEIGVLFDEETVLAGRLGQCLEAESFRVVMNEPYSGKAGLIYAAARHATAHGRRALELEVRQDLATDPSVRARVLRGVANFLRALE